MLELPFGESQGIGNGTWQVDISVAVMTDLLIDLLPHIVTGQLTVLDQSCVIDLRLVGRKGGLWQNHFTRR